MLKWLFGALVLANIGLYMWVSWYKPDAAVYFAAPKTPIAPEKMRLVSDPTAHLRSRTPAEKPVRPLTVVKRTCYSVGAFGAPDQATRAAKRLERAGFSWRTRTEQEKREIYQVYVGPQGNTQAARIMESRLRRLGFRDIALIRDGKLKNAISMGIFRESQNAAAIRTRLKSKGIRAHMDRRTMTITHYWLDVAARDEDVVRLKAIKLYQSGVAIASRSCANAPAMDKEKSAGR